MNMKFPCAVENNIKMFASFIYYNKLLETSLNYLAHAWGSNNLYILAICM